MTTSKKNVDKVIPIRRIRFQSYSELIYGFAKDQCQSCLANELKFELGFKSIFVIVKMNCESHIGQLVHINLCYFFVNIHLKC